jgi:SAM-dependent methyltransferase
VTGCAAREEVGDGHFQLDEFKTRQRALWAAGEYEALSPYITDVGELVVTRAAVEPGMQVLDVACGTGNAARPAARAGARVTGVDLVPKFLEVGRAKAEADGLAIDWREGDAENLPFEEGRFDRVLSTFGHMFAPRHQRTADEMTRVCRRGGAIVTATWLPTGTVGDVFRVAADYLPPPPDYASPPILWGREDHVRELFAGKATAFEFEHQVNRIQWDSLDGFADFFMARFPLMVMAQAMLGERFGEFRARIVDVWQKANQSKDGRLLVPQQYLLSLVRM